jgi:hypothetical protein
MKKISERLKNNFLGSYLGKVEDREDPLKLGRLKIRIFSLHDDKLLTSKLPWFLPAFPITSANKGGIGDSAIPEIDSIVIVQFIEGNINQGIYTHTIPGTGDLPNPDKYLEGTGWRQIKTPSGHIINFKDNEIQIIQDDTKTIIELTKSTINIKAPDGKVNIEAKEVFIQDSTNDGDMLINHTEFLNAFKNHRHPTPTGPSSTVIPGCGLETNKKWYTKTIKVKK